MYREKTITIFRNLSVIISITRLACVPLCRHFGRLTVYSIPPLLLFGANKLLSDSKFSIMRSLRIARNFDNGSQTDKLVYIASKIGLNCQITSGEITFMNIVCLKSKLILVHLLSKPAHELPNKTHS